MTAPSSGSLGDSLRATEITATTYDSAVYNRVSFPIGVFSQGRGVSFKELAAVRQGGSAFNPGQLEMAAGMLKMATDIQFYMFQGNATTSAGAGLTTELGAYNSAGFDGLRSVLGSVGAYTADNATQFDVGTLNLLESMQTGTTRAANNGGMPDIGVLSMNAKQQFDSEQQGNQRYLGDLSETIPGVKVNRYAWANGTIDLLPVPGTTMGTYTRASDSATVEDIYILDSNTLAVVWLYADNFTVLEIPSGVDGILSQRWIIFGRYTCRALVNKSQCGKPAVSVEPRKDWQYRGNQARKGADAVENTRRRESEDMFRPLAIINGQETRELQRNRVARTSVRVTKRDVWSRNRRPAILREGQAHLKLAA